MRILYWIMSLESTLVLSIYYVTVTLVQIRGSMKRVVERLNVLVHGDRLHQARTVDIVYRERMERDVGFQSIQISEPKVTRTGKYRPTQNVADPTPNAPLLKRVVKHPFALECGYFKRSDLPRVQIKPREKIVFPKFVKEQLQKQTKIRTIRPMELHIKAKSPFIPSVDTWLDESTSTGVQ